MHRSHSNKTITPTLTLSTNTTRASEGQLVQATATYTGAAPATLVSHIQKTRATPPPQMDNIATNTMSQAEPLENDATPAGPSISEPTEKSRVVRKTSVRWKKPEEIKRTLEEINTVDLGEPILAHEECLLQIKPLQDKPIKDILSVNVILDTIVNDLETQFGENGLINSIGELDIVHEILTTGDNNSFNLFLKNNTNDSLKIKICYHVVFKTS